MSRISIVGAGKVAFSLVKALLDAGLNVISVFSRTKESSEKLAAKFNIPLYGDDLSAIDSSSELFFLAVPDSEIENAAYALSNAKLDFHKCLFVHLSGSQDISRLKLLKSKGASIASFHIMQTFPSCEVVELRDHFAAIETDNVTTEKYLFDLALKLKLKPFHISSEKKVFYHLTGVWASNFLIANLFNASQVFQSAKISEVEFLQIVKPIINSTFDNVLKNGISSSLSGPVIRGDLETIKKHVSALSSEVLSNEALSPEALSSDSEKADNFQRKHLLLSYLTNTSTLLDLIKSNYGELSDKQKQIGDFLQDMIRRQKSDL
ncbi:MAG: DUF2520 domain-containing protein [Bacteroidota bacterium]|nr:DUF2520 domain-containing protein [Bacteroidota bacterium]